VIIGLDRVYDDEEVFDFIRDIIFGGGINSF
jgi:hypothetical protein